MNPSVFADLGMSLFFSFLEDSFAGNRTINWQSLHTFNMSSHCPLVSKLQYEKLAVNFVENPLYVIFLFYLLLIFFMAFIILSIICLGVDHFEFILFVVCWTCLTCLLFSENFGSCLPLLLLLFFSVPFSCSSPFKTPIMYMLVHLIISYGLLGSDHFPSSFPLSVPNLDNFHWPVFKFIYSLFCQLKILFSLSSCFLFPFLYYTTLEILSSSFS